MTDVKDLHKSEMCDMIDEIVRIPMRHGALDMARDGELVKIRLATLAWFTMDIHEARDLVRTLDGILDDIERLPTERT